MPSRRISCRASSATKKKKFTTCSGVPLKRLRSSGSWVAMPTGQVFRWQARIMMQPVAISGAVEKPISSAPSIAATTTSRRGARAAVVPGDQDAVGVGLGHAGGHGADTDLGHELDGHLGRRVGAAQV